MATQSGEPVSGAAQADSATLAPILAVIEAELHVPGDDWGDAVVAAGGVRYLLAREFRRQQPALALLYDLEFVPLGVRRGSVIFDWKILVRMKRRAASALAEPATAVVLASALALPGAINESITLWERLFPPVQQQLEADLPHAPPVLTVIVIRAPDDRDVFSGRGGEFDLGDA